MICHDLRTQMRTTVTVRTMITGSRNYPHRDDVEAWAGLLTRENILLHGDCPNSPDSWARDTCKANHVYTQALPADWDFSKGAGFIRNRLLVLLAEQVVAFHDGVSSGTLNAIRHAVELHVPTIVYQLGQHRFIGGTGIEGAHYLDVLDRRAARRKLAP